jgi:hypothetical protein
MEKRLVVTRCDSNAERLAKVTHPILECYAKAWNADFKILDHDEEWMTDYEMCHYRILKVGELLDDYDRILVIDTDVIIMPGCPNPFETVDPEKIGSIYEDVGSRMMPRLQVIGEIQDIHGNVGWESGYINTGVFVVSKKHKPIFRKINGEFWTGFGYDDALLGYNIHKFGFEIQELSFKWNHMSMFSEPWNRNANRFNSYIIHYAGAASFPDDQSGRTKGTNDLDSRMRLIIHDTDRIANGLAGFEVTSPTPKQGLGSNTFNALIGVQKKEIVVKVHKTVDGLERECFAFDNKKIPYIVDCYGVTQGADGGNYMLLQKLRDLPDVIDSVLMKKIATNSLIALRQLWKYNIPWICKLDHIMMNDEGVPKLIDFNDDPYPEIPFYGDGGSTESIIMLGKCDSKGNYIDRGKTPRSGWIAVMEYLCEKNDINKDVLYEAEYAMVEYEYQALENVHQPIYFEPYQNILRTESEVGDPDYGKLVPANRECKDRAKMLMDNLALDGPESTWLDIGCNVGWFCFEFIDYYSMTGIDFDKGKIEFATMLAQGEISDAKFIHAEITKEYVEAMPSYDIISALSTLHLKLVADKNINEFEELLTAICSKANSIFIFEFPKHAYGILGVVDVNDFARYVRSIGNFKDVDMIGVSDANRPILKCVKN